MRVLNDLVQGTPEWLQARLGIPTASGFSNLITSQGKRSTSLDKYAKQLAVDAYAGEPEETFKSDWMERGSQLEAEARAWYEFQTDIPIQQVGFVLRDDGTAGCSPDGLSDAGGLELKCPRGTTHIDYLLDETLPTSYVAQVQGCMWLCERDRWDFVSYHPKLPSFLIVVMRDDAFIATLAKLVQEVNDKKNDILEQLRRIA